MSKLKTYLSSLTQRFSSCAFTTPVATLVGSVIIALSIVAYGFIVRPTIPETRDLIQAVAKSLRLKGSQWETCRASEATMNAVSEDYNDGVEAGVTGTPTTYILKKKGQNYEVVARIEGAQSESYVRGAVEQALSSSPQTVPFTGKQPAESEFVKGEPGDVLVIEYADMECPFCIRFHPTIVKVTGEYQERIGYIFRHFPLSEIHPNAVPYALAIECAGTLKGDDAYFSFIDKLFVEQAKQ